ncbi:MAG TPA: CHAT domain-containing tetratricopeptide repeat protein [Gemmataceae bacterium]|jgi:CHAT domain-containing protein/tetratricopeptide (TPR) repeat protein|nr:CHAT domain-containing tetratricopeptide repeat protein [Gemmataceae bacterium]
MRSLTLSFALVVLAVTAVGRAESPPAILPQLSKADEEWVTKKYDEALKFGRVGKWGHDEAQGPVREILELCSRKLGKDHYRTADYQREIDALNKLAGLPEADRAEYVKTYAQYDEIEKLAKDEKYVEALRVAEQKLAIDRRCLGPGSFYEAAAVVRCGELLSSCARDTEAFEQFGRALKMFLKVVGEDHPRTIQVHRYLARNLQARGEYEEAGQHYEAAVKHSIRVFGDGHAWTAVDRNNLARHLDLQILHGEAETIFRLSEKALRAGGDEYRPLLATTLNNLALNLQHQGLFEDADAMYEEALNLRRKISGEDHPETGRVYMNRATNWDEQGNSGAAETLHRKALAIWRKAYGDKNENTAWAMSNLAVNLDNQGKYKAAEQYMRDALAIMQALPGNHEVAIAKMSNNLSSCLRAQGEDDRKLYADAQDLCEQALAKLRDRLGPDHPDVAAIRNNLAAVLEDREQHADAEEHLRAALATMKKRLGESHPETAYALVNLSVNLYHQGRFGDAEPYLRLSLDITRRRLGEGHPRTAWVYQNLVGNACARGDYDAAAAFTAAATNSFETARLRLGLAGLDRALRTEQISPLQGLAVAAAHRGNPDVAWQMLERDLARGLLDDLSAQPLNADERKRELALLGKLNVLDRRIDLLHSRGRVGDVDRREAEKAREAAQAELVQFQADMANSRKGHGVAGGLVYDLDRVQKQIPEGVALIAWIDLPFVPNWHDPRGDHWACLVKRTGAPIWVRLEGTGAGKAWTVDDSRLPNRVRRAINERQAKGNWKDLTQKLAAQRFGPLEAHLADVRHLVVLPSSRLSEIPIDLLTDRLVSYAPSATMFAWLREKQTSKAPSYLLAVGNPDFKKGEDGQAPLPGTLQEVTAIARVFKQTQQLKGSAASEQNLDKLAAEPDGLRRFGYLHFATHALLDKQRPMRSALVLAQTRPTDGGDFIDGRLTAEQILRNWKLDADLVTLSACKSGLGRAAGGEGYLGFSQALFFAGARSLVLSLWEVDDAATSLLMTRFYENLMGLPKGVPGGPIDPKPKAEALAEAKRWLATLRPEDVQQLTEGLVRDGTRGQVIKKAPITKAAMSYEHPYYWSGFVLVGDPR